MSIVTTHANDPELAAIDWSSEGSIHVKGHPHPYLAFQSNTYVCAVRKQDGTKCFVGCPPGGYRYDTHYWQPKVEEAAKKLNDGEAVVLKWPEPSVCLNQRKWSLR